MVAVWSFEGIIKSILTFLQFVYSVPYFSFTNPPIHQSTNPLYPIIFFHFEKEKIKDPLLTLFQVHAVGHEHTLDKCLLLPSTDNFFGSFYLVSRQVRTVQLTSRHPHLRCCHQPPGSSHSRWHCWQTTSRLGSVLKTKPAKINRH